MGLTKVFINNVCSTFLKSMIKLQGDRGVDQANITLPPCVNTAVNDCIHYIQDIADLDNLKLFLAFDDSLGDEAGDAHNGSGFDNIPIFRSKWSFECNLTDDGEDNTLAICCCGASVFATGKICKAFSYNGSTSLIAPNECCYDYEHYHKFGISTWINMSNLASDQGIVVKSNDLTTGIGYKLYFCNASNRVVFTLADGTTAFSINSSACSISTSKWFHVVATYNAGSNETNMALYINGECDTNSKACASICCTIKNNVALTLGAESDGGSKAVCGMLQDETYIFEKNLSSCEIMRLFHEGSLSYQACGKWGKSVKFDGCRAFFNVCDSTDFDLCGKFEMIWWMKAASSCCERTIFHKTTNGTDGIDFTVSATTGIANFRFRCTTMSSTTDVTNNAFRQIRVKRDSCDLISLYICNVKEDCTTDCANGTTSAKLEFGRNQSCAEYFNGELDSFRWYKGNLNAGDLCNLFTSKNPISIGKFGGKVTKINKEMVTKDLVAQSFGKTLAEVCVEPKRFVCKSPEFIVNDLIVNNTCYITIPYPACSGLLITNYLADGKLHDLIDDLISLIGATFYTSPLNVFHFLPKEFVIKTNQFTHGCNTRIWETKFDDTELVNDITVLGENKRYQRVQLFCGDASTTVFTIAESSVSTRVEHPLCTELIPELCFTVCTLGKTVTFTCAPACGCCNIRVSYEYETPLFFRGIKQDSIDANGVHSKRLILPWITNRGDGTRFINGYLNRFSTIRTNVKIEHPALLTSLRENDVIHAKNDIKGIDTTFAIKSITYKWPEFESILDVGEYTLFADINY